jgi:hypothetical protein
LQGGLDYTLVGRRTGSADAADGRLPALTAVDEGSVEPSPSALPSFLSALPGRLRYPVAIDTTGRVADGYQVQGEPWLVLTSATGKILWYDAVETSRWPRSPGCGPMSNWRSRVGAIPRRPRS